MQNGFKSHLGTKYRKKPVVIDAIQWTGDNIDEIIAFMYPQEPAYMGPQFSNADELIGIETLEGLMVASLNDWILRGVQKELYPCKPNIFQETYEKVNE